MTYSALLRLVHLTKSRCCGCNSQKQTVCKGGRGGMKQVLASFKTHGLNYRRKGIGVKCNPSMLIIMLLLEQSDHAGLKTRCNEPSSTHEFSTSHSSCLMKWSNFFFTCSLTVLPDCGWNINTVSVMSHPNQHLPSVSFSHTTHKMESKLCLFPFPSSVSASRRRWV